MTAETALNIQLTCEVVLRCVQECAQLSKELTELQERLSERDDEISELKAERNNTRVSMTSVLVRTIDVI